MALFSYLKKLAKYFITYLRVTAKEKKIDGFLNSNGKNKE